MKEYDEVNINVCLNGWIVSAGKTAAVATSTKELKVVLKSMLKPKGLNKKVIDQL